MRVALLVLAILCAGCVTRPVPVGTDAEPSTLPWGISECAYVIASVAADAERLRERLPEGFDLAPSPLGALPAGPSAEIHLDAYACASGVGLGGNVTPFAYGSHYVPARPPDALREEGYDAAFVKWDAYFSDAGLREALRAGGLPVRDGDARVSLTAVPGGGFAVDAALSFAEGGGFTLRGVAGPADPLDEPLPFVEFTPLEGGGLARWHARLHNASFASGTGVVELAEGSWVREVVGAASAPATFIAGAWNLDQADVTFPIAWP